ncbi:M56 family metallopeptidase [Erythrobacter sp. MTPC3]|uniref:M56 family metallopeptidase n=1 Tax=Erythrobacter sp. MTPC3 TaxID=3056564 RepID=UPI0036F3C69A
MTAWLFDTLVWTAALIALVLIIRRPVARWFGPQIAYALWMLPALRLLMPGITLPHWLAPDDPATITDTTNYQMILDQGSDAPVATLGSGGSSLEAGSAASLPSASITPTSLLEAAPWVELGFAVWLAGAAIFLWHRFSTYFDLRRELLADAREVGRSGRIRLIETGGTKAPLAFGVIDPVVALPSGFMAQDDRVARDLALAHELSHHRANDLLINIAVQPLFAIHWFNPLGRYGWLALRRDQEAACDARVISEQPEKERAAYANLIATTAAGPNLALAAPMACPVLGDKSIIHRLRNLNMSDTSNTRRMAGRFMVGAAIIALPLTASVSYAENSAPEPPAAPQVSVTAPAPPAPPAPPTPVGPSVAPPLPPVPPAAPAVQAMVAVDPDIEIERDENRQTVVHVVQDFEESGDRKTTNKVQTVKVVNHGKKMSQEEMDALIAELREDLAEADREVKLAMKEVEKAVVEIRTSQAETGRTIVKMECHGDSGEVAFFEERDGKPDKVYICQSRVLAHALTGLKEARKAIAKNAEITGDMRENVLEELDEQIESWTAAQNQS